MIREFYTKKERNLLLIVLFLAAALIVFIWLFPRLSGKKEPYAEISFNGETVATIDFAHYPEPSILSMNDLGKDIGIRFEIQDQQIRFLESDCPDKLCVGFGFIGKPGQTAVCLPNRVAVTILS